MKRALLGLALILVTVLVMACQTSAPTPAPSKTSGGTSPASTSAPKEAPKEAAKEAPKEAPKPAAKEAAPASQPAPAVTKANLEQELYEAAKKEGEVIWHTPSIADEQLEILLGAFRKKYPGIKTSFIKSSSSDIINRILTEAPAGRLSQDVGLGGVVEMGPLLDRDLLVSYDFGKVSDIPANNIMLGGKFLAVYELPYGWYYNTRLVAEQDLPKSFEDLLLPRWKGRKLGLLVSGSIGFEAMAITGKWNDQKYEQFLKDLKAQELIIEPRGAGLAQRTADGQIQMSANTLTLMPDMISKGAPIGLVPIGPLSTHRFGVYTFKGAPHPNAAKLLMSFLASNDAKAAWNQTGRGAATPCDASGVAKLLCDRKVEVMLEDGGERTKAIGKYEKMNRTLLELPSS